MDIKVLLNGPFPFDQLSEIYSIVGWNRVGSFTVPALQKILEKTSRYVTAFEGFQLVGFGRVISDDIFLVQPSDVMVRLEFRKRVIGLRILKHLLDALPPNAKTIRMIDGLIHLSIWETLGYHTVPAKRLM